MVRAASALVVPQASSAAALGVLPVEVLVVVGAKQGGDPVLLARGGERAPLRPRDALLTFDHQAEIQPGLLGCAGRDRSRAGRRSPRCGVAIVLQACLRSVADTLPTRRAKLQVVNAWRRSPFFRFDVAVVSVVATLIVGLALAGAGGGDPPSPGARHATTVTVDPGASGPAVPAGFLGLSIEYPALEAYAGSDPSSLDPVFEQLVRNLAPGQAPVLRIGGNSADRTWWPTAGVQRPPGRHVRHHRSVAARDPRARAERSAPA